jgi:hypothetical protein
MMSRRLKVLIGIALVAFAIGLCGALFRGFWGVSQDCHEWVDRNGYQLVHDQWWAKSRGCVARTPDRTALYHDEELRSKAIGWAWQFTIFAAGTLPAVCLVVVSTVRWRRSAPQPDS